MESFLPLVILIIFIVSALAMSIWLRRWKSSWSTLKVATLAALPIPALATSLFAFVIADAWSTPRERCGVDACGMAIAAGLFMIMLMGVYYLISVGITVAMLRARSKL